MKPAPPLAGLYRVKEVEKRILFIYQKAFLPNF